MSAIRPFTVEVKTEDVEDLKDAWQRPAGQTRKHQMTGAKARLWLM